MRKEAFHWYLQAIETLYEKFADKGDYTIYKNNVKSCRMAFAIHQTLVETFKQERHALDEQQIQARKTLIDAQRRLVARLVEDLADQRHRLREIIKRRLKDVFFAYDVFDERAFGGHEHYSLTMHSADGLWFVRPKVDELLAYDSDIDIAEL